MEQYFMISLFVFHDTNVNVVDWQVYVPEKGENFNDITDKALQICRTNGYDTVSIYHSKRPGKTVDLFATELDADG